MGLQRADGIIRWWSAAYFLALPVFAGLAGCGTSLGEYLGLHVSVLDTLPEDDLTVNPAGVTTRTTGPFGNLVGLTLEENVSATLEGRIEQPGQVVTYDIGAVNIGDQIIAQVVALDQGFDPAIAVFDGNLDCMHLNDDRNYFGRVRDAEVDFIVRAATDHAYVVVASSPRADTAGSFELRLARLPGNRPEPAVHQVFYLDFEGANSVVIASRAPVTIPPFSGDMIADEYMHQTEALIAGLVARVREDFEGYHVSIVSSREAPPPDEQHSTVFFGAYNPTLLGIADNVDSFNRRKVQEAIVFVDTFTVFMSQEPTLAEMIDALANVASHEIGHLLGLHHTADSEGIMDTTASLRKMLLPQQFRRSPFNGLTFDVGHQNAPAVLTTNVGATGLPRSVAAKRAPAIDPWYQAGPQGPVRSFTRLSTHCACDGH